MDKQIVAYTYNEILAQKKGMKHTDSYYKVIEPKKHYAKWKNQNEKVYILYDSIHMKYTE